MHTSYGILTLVSQFRNDMEHMGGLRCAFYKIGELKNGLFISTLDKKMLDCGTFKEDAYILQNGDHLTIYHKIRVHNAVPHIAWEGKIALGVIKPPRIKKVYERPVYALQSGITPRRWYGYFVREHLAVLKKCAP